MKAKLPLWASMALIGLAGCSLLGGQIISPKAKSDPQNASPEVSLNVFAAASLSGAFTQMGKDFEDLNPWVRVVFNFAGSQQLSQQIKSGAPADVFASAATQQMDDLGGAGLLDPTKAISFARNHLVVIYPADNPGHLKNIQDLARPGLKIIVAAKEVPAGQYTLSFIDKAAQDPALGVGYSDRVLKNVISYEENVEAVVSKVALGDADAGIAYTSDARGASAGHLGWFAIPDAYNVTAVYPIAVVTASSQQQAANAFVAYVLSPGGQKTLEQYGFLKAKP